MSKKRIFIGLGVLGFLILCLFLLNYYIKDRIEDKIRSTGKAKIEYEQLDIGFLGKNIEITGLTFITSKKNFKASKLTVKDISLFQYLVNDRVRIEEVFLFDPTLTWTGNFKNGGKEQGQLFNRKIIIKKLKISNGIINGKKTNAKRSSFYIRFPKFLISDISLDSSTVKKYIPFNYGSYKIDADSVQLKLNSEHDIAASEFQINNGKVSINDFQIIPLYSKVEFDKVVPYEKDRITLDIKKIDLEDLTFGSSNETLKISNPSMQISGADLFIYRNRILPDDPRNKVLYNEKLRKLPVKLIFEHINISSGNIEYEEVTERDGGPAKIKFHQVEGTIENLKNVQQDEKEEPRVQVTANSLFMNQVPVEIEWSFDVFNFNNKFLFSGESGKVPGSALNPYLIPALGIEADGSLNSVYFTFTGNEEKAIGDVRVNYENFSINLLEEGSREEKELISAIANLLIDNDGHSGNSVKDIQVNRNKKKTFWFYIWSAVKKGIIESVEQF